MNYLEQLQHPKWQKKRLEILNRDNFKCQSCSSEIKSLHVHHFSYNKNPWDVDNDYLITLCNDCHSDEEILKLRLFDVFKSISKNSFVLYKDFFDILIQIYDNYDLDKSISVRDHFLKAKQLIKQNG